MTDRLPLPVYRDTRGQIRPISGPHAERWPHPRVIEIDGATFVEWPLPSETGWGLTFHAMRRPRTPIGEFVAQFVEGRSSAFPLWPVVMFSARAAVRRAMRRRAVC